MADWKQITARIRRARGSKDPAGQLANLFEKTHDAMVAFELAKHFETTGQTAESVKWYAAAAERFRRADWKSKAQEAIGRLGGVVPEAVLAPAEVPSESLGLAAVIPPGPGLPPEENAAAIESAMAVSSELQAATETANPQDESAASGRGRRRRGRRGGRNRNRGERPDASVTPSAVSRAGPSANRLDAVPAASELQRHRETPDQIDPGIGRPEPSSRGRFGDPGLSSRLTLLEMQFRRLLACAPMRLDHADKAPAGPGVFVLTDEDLTSYYYVEACDTLRIAIGHLTRGGGGRRGNPTLKPQLAEHLGITEARVGKYLTDHCVVRWLQLDEGATFFAHYVIAVLRPILNQ